MWGMSRHEASGGQEQAEGPGGAVVDLNNNEAGAVVREVGNVLWNWVRVKILGIERRENGDLSVDVVAVQARDETAGKEGRPKAYGVRTSFNVHPSGHSWPSTGFGLSASEASRQWGEEGGESVPKVEDKQRESYRVAGLVESANDETEETIRRFKDAGLI